MRKGLLTGLTLAAVYLSVESVVSHRSGFLALVSCIVVYGMVKYVSSE